MHHLPTVPLFPSGQIVATPGALDLLEQANKTSLEFLSRHLRGDWGELCQEDKTENELSLKQGFRVMSSYQVTKTGLSGSSPRQTVPSPRYFSPTSTKNGDQYSESSCTARRGARRPASPALHRESTVFIQ